MSCVAGKSAPASDPHGPMMFGNDLVRYPQAETGPGDSFGREEWFEDAAEGVLIHSRAVIRNGNGNASLSGSPIAGHCRA